MVTEIKLINYKIHENFVASPDGRSFAIVGDLEVGKSTVIEVIESSLMLRPFDANPLSNGKEIGSLEVTHDFGDGHKYTVKRRFNRKGLLRIEVTDENGGEHSLKPLLEKTFGKAFTNAHFDYIRYFYDCKTTEARTEYLVKAFGREDVLVNLQTIKVRVKERNQVGGEKETYLTLVENSILDPETLADDIELYKEPKPLEAISEYEPLNELRHQLKDKDILQEAYDSVKIENDLYDDRVERNKVIDERVAEIEKELKLLKAEKKKNEKWLKDFPSDRAYEQELAEDLRKADLLNELLQPQMEEAITAGYAAINEFNQRRVEFNNAIGFYEKYMELEGRWINIDESINKLRETNREIFRERLPLPELSIEDDVVYYQCKDGVNREFCFPNISKGRSIILAVQIQRALNPKGNNLAIIPDGGLLGSGLEDISEELKKFGVQYIVEITEPKQKVTVRFEEELFKKNKK